MEVVSPLVSRRQPQKEFSGRAWISLLASVLLLALGLVALSTMDGSSTANSEVRRTELFGLKGNIINAIKPRFDQLLQNSGQSATAVTGETRGSIPTDEQEASVIMGSNGPEMERNMGNLFLDRGLEERGHTNPEGVADAIVDAANDANEDVTGKRGADYYNSIIAHSKHPERLTGSLPTYHAESTYITSGIVGNYERSLENSRLAGISVNPHANPREVANQIVDSAVLDTTDCTGTVGADGKHATGKPNCPPVERFNNELHKIENGPQVVGGAGRGG